MTNPPVHPLLAALSQRVLVADGAMGTMLQAQDPSLDDFARRVSIVEQELLWAGRQGLRVPAYVARAFREAVDHARAGHAA